MDLKLIWFLVFFVIFFKKVKQHLFYIRETERKLLLFTSKVNGKLRRSRLSFPFLEYRGRLFKIKIINSRIPLKYDSSKHNPGLFVIRLVKTCSFRLWIRKNIKNLKLKKIFWFFYKEIQIKIPEFENKVFLRTKNEVKAKNYLANNDVCRAISQLFDMDWSDLLFDRKGIKIARVLYLFSLVDKEKDILNYEQDKVIQTLDKLSILGDYLI